ncbi:hypothetical protein FRC17_000893 [Serendipita sp. 399]|nr:hypothetical protein FRC17_000893 [Serendipita sp. 399]
MEDGNQYLDGCPVQILREVLEDGTDEFIGDITIVRESPQRAWVGPEDEDNLRKPVGDPSILYSIGDYLAPTHHRRGIMSTTLRTLINEWAIPRMNCKKISATAFVGNAASIGVFKKVGFEHVGDMTKALTLPPSRGGHSMGVHLLEWACK